MVRRHRVRSLSSYGSNNEQQHSCGNDMPFLEGSHFHRFFFGQYIYESGRSIDTDLPMIKFLLWCILFVLCWPLAVLALLLYPIVWLVLLPFRLVGVAVSGVLELIWLIVALPAALLRKATAGH